MKKLKVHFTGIKGVGMTPLAIIAKQAGFEVTGSDVDEEFITDTILKKEKISNINNFSYANIKDQDLVIITGAHGGYSNIEAKIANEKGINVITQGEAVGLFMDGEIFKRNFLGISVSGTHGKTTTSAMIATILKENKLDPSYVIGTSSVPSLDGPGHFGSGKYFVAEADEYATEPTANKKAKFLWQYPDILVITNIEFDHPDIYESIDHTRETYLKLTENIKRNGVLICCGDDPQIIKMLQETKCRYITYGLNKNNDYILDNLHFSSDHMFFTLTTQGMVLSEFMINVVGEHNGLNAAAAIVSALELGLPIDKIKKGIMAFSGSKRRLEFVGNLSSGAKVYDDYAHHPTEIKSTLKALRTQYPTKKIIAVFQPHTYSRTKNLFEEFIRSFGSVDSVIISDIYASNREISDGSITSLILAERLSDEHKDVLYLAMLSDVVKYLNEKRFRSDTVIVTLGAGDIYKINTELKFE